MAYDYLEAVQTDVREYIKDEITRTDYTSDKDGLQTFLNDELWTVDSVTGNASGSYTFNTYQAEENLCHNLDLLGEALSEFGCSNDYLITNGAEAADVTIRLYLLPQAINDILEELENEGYFEEV